LTNLHCPVCGGELEFIGDDPDSGYDEETGELYDDSQVIYDCYGCARQLFYPHDWERKAEGPDDSAAARGEGAVT